MNDTPPPILRIFVPLAAGFLFNGIATVLLGPLIPEMGPRWAVGPQQLAYLFVAQFLASALGSILSSHNLRLSLFAGYGSIALGLVGLAFLPWPEAIVGAALLGFGVGLVSPATNVWLGLRLGPRRAQGLTALNFIWGLGATVCPLLFTLRAHGLDASSLLVVLAMSTLVAALWIAWILSRLPRLATATPEATAPSPADAPEATPRTHRWTLGYLALLMFLYVGCETTLGGWLVSLSDELGEAQSQTSLLIGSSFWGSLLVGRGLSGIVLGRVAPSRLYPAGLGIALLGVSVVLLLPNRTGLAVAAPMAGFGLAPLFPLQASFLTTATAQHHGRGAGWVFACTGLGGGALPWLTAHVAGESLHSGFVVPLIALGAMAMIFILLRRLAPQTLGDPGGFR